MLKEDNFIILDDALNNYITNFKNSQFYNKITPLLVFCFIFSLFFPIRHVFFTKEAFLTGDYSDFTSFSLYLSDILLFTTWFLVILPRGGKLVSSYANLKRLSTKHLALSTLIFWLILAFFLHFGLNTRFNVYFLLKWLELIVAYGTFTVLFRETGLKTWFFKLFVWFCALESIIALVQFASQSSTGLYKLGESHLSPAILGVAKIVSGGTTFIRGYGTFPHPNPFSAFLVAGILIGAYLLLQAADTKSKISHSILIFLNILGLTVTFSRGADLALGVGLILFFGFSIWREGMNLIRSPMTVIVAMTVIAISILTSTFIFKPFLLARATFSDQSTIDRKFYDQVGLKMAEKNPIFGVGIGESVLHMEQYSGKTLQPWEKQPPHNYFIISAAELGIPGALILIWLLLSHLKSLIINLKSEFSIYLLTLTSILFAFLLLMQFDHYFYTLQQTQLLLWVILALIASEIKNPQQED